MNSIKYGQISLSMRKAEWRALDWAGWAGKQAFKIAILEWSLVGRESWGLVIIPTIMEISYLNAYMPCPSIWIGV